MSTLISALVNAQRVPLAVLNKNLEVVAWNMAMAELSGIAAEEVIGGELSTLFDIRNQDPAGHLENNQPFQLPVAGFFLRSRGDEDRSSDLDWLNIRFVPFSESDGPRYWLISVTGDETLFGDTADMVGFIESLSGPAQLYRKASALMGERRDKMREAEKLASIGQLAAGVAHEVNNPVGYVYSNLTILREYATDLLDMLRELERMPCRVDGGESVTDVLADLKRRADFSALREDLLNIVDESIEGIDRVKNIVLALKDFSHVDQDVFVSYDLHKGIETTLRVAHNEIKYKADVVCEFSDIPSIECVPSRINQVILNLLVNAAQAMEEHGRIVVRTRAEGNNVVVEVEDNGQGMSQDVRKRIFEPFFTTKPKGKGTGLGLPLSYSIVREHAGELRVDSELGKGTCFRITLPVRGKCSESGLGTSE